MLILSMNDILKNFFLKNSIEYFVSYYDYYQPENNIYEKADFTIDKEKIK